jgi:PCFT/HCP family folate transporter-like MFS transporter 1/3
VGVPIGTALSGVLFRELGFYGVYIIATVLYIFAFVYGMIFIKENKTETSVERKKEPSRDTSCVDFLKDFFSLSHIKEAIRVTFKEGQHNRRLRIISLMVVVIVVMGPLHG